MIMKNGTRKWGLQLPQWSKSPLGVEAAMSSKAKPNKNLNPPPTTSYRKRIQQEKKWHMKTSHTIIINNIIPIFVFFPFLLF
jgi:hypothetical protein